MSQIDTTPPASFHPQPESYPTFDWQDEQTVPPVPNLYLPEIAAPMRAVHLAPSERITTATYELGNSVPVQIVAKSEQGIGSRITLSIFNLGANVAIATDQESLLSLYTGAAPLTAMAKGAYMLTALPAGLPPTLQLATCAELWAIAVTNATSSVSWISVLQEQFYGD